MLIKFMCEAKHHYTYKGILIFILCYLKTLQILGQLWHDWDIFYKVGQHHSPDFVVPSEALRQIAASIYYMYCMYPM